MKIKITNNDQIQEVLDDHQEELLAAHPTSIVIEPGIYRERVHLYGNNVTVIGQPPVIITNGLGALALGHNKTFFTATFLCEGQNISLTGLTIVNSAGLGENVGQAVAFYGNGDRFKLHDCAFLGNQDTLCLGPIIQQNRDGSTTETPVKARELLTARYVLTECFIQGNVDYIFGGGSALFEHCRISSTQNGRFDDGYICAPCTEKQRPFGFVFNQCQIVADRGADGHYLGRPWRRYAKAYYLDCQLAPSLAHSGWHDWAGDPDSTTDCDFRTYGCTPAVRQQSWTRAGDEVPAALQKQLNDYFGLDR